MNVWLFYCVRYKNNVCHADITYEFSYALGMIKQFLRDVDWGEIDYLLIDTPPGTSDEHLSIAQYLKESDVDGAIVITTPQVKWNSSERIMDEVTSA